MKRFLVMMLALALVFSLAPIAGAADGEQAADTLYELGLFRGTSTDSAGQPVYSLDARSNRSAAVTMLVRLLGQEEAAMAGEWDIPFTDVDEWAQPYIGYAYANGLTKGISADKFGGSQRVTHQQYLVMMLRALGYSDSNAGQAGAQSADFLYNQAREFATSLGMPSLGDTYLNDFYRADMAELSLITLKQLTKQDKTLIEQLIEQKVVSRELVIQAGLEPYLKQSRDKGKVTVLVSDDHGYHVSSWTGIGYDYEDLILDVQSLLAQLPEASSVQFRALDLGSSVENGWGYTVRHALSDQLIKEYKTGQLSGFESTTGYEVSGRDSMSPYMLVFDQDHNLIAYSNDIRVGTTTLTLGNAGVDAKALYEKGAKLMQSLDEKVLDMETVEVSSTGYPSGQDNKTVYSVKINGQFADADVRWALSPVSVETDKAFLLESIQSDALSLALGQRDEFKQLGRMELINNYPGSSTTVYGVDLTGVHADRIILCYKADGTFLGWGRL